jgi:hypothetical protein
MDIYLGGHDIRDNFAAIFNHRSGCFIAGSFNTQDFHGVN